MYPKNSFKNAPLAQQSNIPLGLMVQSNAVHYKSKRRYIKAQEVDALAVRKYKTNSSGITFDDLLYSGLAEHKLQAQNILKRCLSNKILFVIKKHKPQQYFPATK